MKSLYLLIALILVFPALTACGGGGGGSDGESTGTPPGGTTPPPGGAPPPSGGTPPPAGGTPPIGSTAPSTAEIVFPWQKSSALGSSVIVRGKASDPDGVAAVRVNGVEAALVSPAVQVVSAKSAGSAVQATSESQVRETAESTEVVWSLELELETGENDVVVTVEDGTGEETSDADDATIKYAEVPDSFTSDRNDSRLVGWSRTLTDKGYVTQLVQFDHSNQEQTVFSELQDLGIASCFRSQTNELVYVALPSENEWQVRSFDLAARTSRVVSDVSALMAPDPGFNGPLLVQIVCSSVHERAYVLANYSDNAGPMRSRLIEVELSGNSSILTETDPSEVLPWFAYKIALGHDALVSVTDFMPDEPMTRISLQDGTPTPLAPSLDVGALAMVAALELGRVYVTTLDGVEEIDLAGESKRNVSVVAPTDPLIFSQANSLALDLANDRVIVGDLDLGVLVGVDLTTGERSELLSRKIGAGPPMITLRNIVLDAAGTTAYVTDDGGNAAEKLFEIDLATGDRRVIGDLDHPLFNHTLTGVALDEAGGHVYVARGDGLGTVLQIELETEAVTPITSSGDGLLQAVADVVFDAENQRLLVPDTVTDAVVAVDVATRQKVLISRAGERGEGPAFDGLVSLTMGEDGASVYVGDQAADQILRVDLETGDRAVVETTCELGSSQTLQQVLYDGATNELLILSSDGFRAFDLETSICTSIPPRLSPLGIAMTSEGRILAADFNQLVQIDRQSGDVVIVSK